MNAFEKLGKLFVKIILLIFSLMNSVFSQVSDLSFDRIFLEEGLSQSIVKCILQDSSGFMYFGTEDGLNIYDAYSFKILRNSPGDQNSLSYNDISCICEDRFGRIWIGTFNSGINIYIRAEKKIIRLNYRIGDPGTISNDNINTVVEDKKGNIWIGTDNGLNRIKNSSKDKYFFTAERGVKITADSIILGEGKILSLTVSRTGEIWAGTVDGLFEIKSTDNKEYFGVRQFKESNNTGHALSNNTIRTVFEDKSGNIWIGTDNGLNMLAMHEKDKTKPLIRKYYASEKNINSISHNEIYAIREDSTGLIWIGTNGGGINIYNPRKDNFAVYEFDPLNPRSLSTNEIRSLYLDRSGIMWIGTYGGGINKVSRKSGQFYHYIHQTNIRNSLNHSIIWSFYQDADSILWIGTHNGLDRLDRKTNKFSHLVHVPGKNSLSNNIVRVVIPYDNERLLIGTNGGGIDELNIKTGLFRNWCNVPGDSNSLIQNEIRAIYKDKDGIIWIGTYGGGMDRFDPSSGNFRHYHNIPGDAASLSQNYVRVIVEDKDGYLWIGTEGGGLNKFDKRTGKFISFRSRYGDSSYLSSDYIFSVLIDTSDIIWLGTFGGGLNKFYPDRDSCAVYTVDNGLASNSVYGILKDSKGYLWLSTNNGLSRFNPASGKFKNYNIKDGLQDNEFNGGSYYRTASGELMFGGINGFNAFYPENIKDNNYIPPVVLTSFKKFNEEVDFKVPLEYVKEIELSYSENFFSFEFAALDYFSPSKNKYAYMMKGVDKNWVYVNADKRFASYTTLSPGNYVFQVKGSNSDGIWNEEGVKLIIRIVPPFWQRLWFILLIVVLLSAIAYSLYLRHLKIIRMKIELSTAHDAQLSIMPEKDPVIEKLEVSGACIPANEVGGDFFDYFGLNNDESKFGILIGDVSGKGMKAAVTAIMTYGMILSEIRTKNNINEILDNVNRSLMNKIEKKMFVSACLCLIDPEKKILSVANAGLTRPIIVSEGRIELLQSEGPRLPLGVKNDIHYNLTEYKLNQNDLIILTTDGVDEAQNNNRELYGSERLKNHLLSLAGNNLPAVDIKNSIIEEVRKFIKNDRPKDDMTVLVIRIK